VDPSNKKENVQAAPRLSKSSDASELSLVVWALQLWALSALLSLLLGGGLSRAIRGAMVGGEHWIARVDHVANSISQVAALGTSLLLVHMALLNVRTSSRLLVSLVAVLFACPPAIILFQASKMPVFHLFGTVGIVCAGASLLLCALQARTAASLQLSIFVGGLTLLATALRAISLGKTSWSLVELSAHGAQYFLIWATVALSLGQLLWAERRAPWKGAVLLGSALLLAATIPIASNPNAAPALVLLGRTLSEIAPYSALGPSAPLALSLALLGLVGSLSSTRGTLSRMVIALIALCAVSPHTPLVTAWFTLCGFTSAVIAAHRSSEPVASTA